MNALDPNQPAGDECLMGRLRARGDEETVIMPTDDAPDTREALQELLDAYITECVCRIPFKADADAAIARLEATRLVRQARAAIAKDTGVTK